MTKTQDELYQLALSKMAIPTCECLLDEPDNSNTTKKDNNNDTPTEARSRNLLAPTPHPIS
jgi:hypothetical protein